MLPEVLCLFKLLLTWYISILGLPPNNLKVQGITDVQQIQRISPSNQTLQNIPHGETSLYRTFFSLFLCLFVCFGYLGFLLSKCFSMQLFHSMMYGINPSP